MFKQTNKISIYRNLMLCKVSVIRIVQTNNVFTRRINFYSIKFYITIRSIQLSDIFSTGCTGIRKNVSIMYNCIFSFIPDHNRRTFNLCNDDIIYTTPGRCIGAWRRMQAYIKCCICSSHFYVQIHKRKRRNTFID